MADGVDPSQEDIERMLDETGDGPFVMLNLLRYADGTGEAYSEYAVKAQPFLDAVGGELLYAGDCATPLVAPDQHRWDAMLLVRYPSKEKFLEMLSNPEYLEVTKIRSAALSEAVLQVTKAWSESPEGH